MVMPRDFNAMEGYMASQEKSEVSNPMAWIESEMACISERPKWVPWSGMLATGMPYSRALYSPYSDSKFMLSCMLIEPPGAMAKNPCLAFTIVSGITILMEPYQGPSFHIWLKYLTRMTRYVLPAWVVLL